MTVQLPTGTDPLNIPDHAFSHRVFANDDAAPEQSVVVNSSGGVDMKNGDVYIENHEFFSYGDNGHGFVGDVNKTGYVSFNGGVPLASGSGYTIPVIGSNNNNTPAYGDVVFLTDVNYIGNGISGAKGALLNIRDLTVPRIFYFPDATGTIALTSNLSSYVPVSTFQRTILGEIATYTIINPGTGFTGGEGPGFMGGGDNGGIVVDTVDENGGILTSHLGSGGTGYVAGTTYNLTMGGATASVDTVNDFQYNALFDISLLSSDQTFTFPNGTGTFALTSDISNFVPYTVGQPGVVSPAITMTDVIAGGNGGLTAGTGNADRGFLDIEYLNDLPYRRVANFDLSLFGGVESDIINTFILPNTTGGTIALISDLSTLVPYTGATSNVNLGLNSLIFEGGSNISSLGTNMSIVGANQEDVLNPNGFGEDIEIVGGDGTTGQGGQVWLYGGYSSSGLPGSIYLQPGYDDSNNIGNIYLMNPLGGDATLDISQVSSNQIFTFPNKTGTIALTSDLDLYVPYTGSVNDLDMSGNNIIMSGGATVTLDDVELSGVGVGQLLIGSVAGDYGVILDSSGLSLARSLTIPDKDGTIAVTSDIPDVSGYAPLESAAFTGNPTLQGGFLKIGGDNTNSGALELMPANAAYNWYTWVNIETGSGEGIRLQKGAYPTNSGSLLTITSSGIINGSSYMNIPYAVNVGSSTGTYTSAAAGMQLNGASNTSYSLGVNAGTVGTLAANYSYSKFLIGSGTITEASSGTHPMIATAAIKPQTVTNGAATVTNTSTLYIENAMVGGTDNFAVWVDDGEVRIDGDIGDTTNRVTKGWFTDIEYTNPPTGPATQVYQGYSTIATPADATTYYFGSNGFTVGTSAGFYRYRMLKTGTIRTIIFDNYYSGTRPTNEASTINLKVNAGGNNVILNTFHNDVNAASFKVTGLSIAVTEGDYIEFNWVTPTWVTNPGTSVMIKQFILVY